MNYFLMRIGTTNEYIGTFAHVVYLGMEAAQVSDVVCAWLVCSSILFLSCLSIRFWLREIWLVV